MKQEKGKVDKKIIRPCPWCGKEVDFSKNAYRPFCSKRCKLADLGSWFKEEYHISSSFLEIEEQPKHR